DWQINGVVAAFSGQPFTVTASGTSLNTPSNTQTADLVGTFNVLGAIGNSGKWFDTSAFAQPTGVRFGTTGRNQFYGPGGWTLDFSLFRSFPMGGTRRLEYRLQAANLLNHPVFGNPQGSFTSGTFGQITGISGNGSYLERQIQMGFRFSFLSFHDGSLSRPRRALARRGFFAVRGSMDATASAGLRSNVFSINQLSAISAVR